MLHKSTYKLIALFISSICFAQTVADTIPMELPYTSKQIVIDGDIEEWGKYFEFEFQDTMTFLHQSGDHEIMTFYDEKYDYSNTNLPLSKNELEIRICWNMENLFFAFKVLDQHLFAEVRQDANYPEFHLNDAIEIYIDSKNDSREKMDLNDYQFIVDINNNSVVLRGDRKYIESDTMSVPKDIGQNILFESAAVYTGSINDSAGNDKGYIIEIAIPFAAIGIKPDAGHLMKLDLCNDDADYSFRNAQTMQDSANIYYAFNWSGQNDFGYPEFWKPVVFSGGPGWYERFSAKYDRYWLPIYALTLLISVLTLMWLIFRIRKLKKLPVLHEMSHSQKSVFSGSPHQMDVPLSLNQKILKQATEIIEEKPDESIRSELLARELGVSLRNLQRITRTEIDCTPTNFIWLVKLNLASEFLKNRQGNVSEAAYEFGFSNPSHFSRMFKNHFGVSPREYQAGNTSSSDQQV